MGVEMITTGRFERSSCYWGKYTTLSGEPRMLHASRADIVSFAERHGYSIITPKVISDYFHHVIKQITDSATFSRNNAKLTLSTSSAGIKKTSA